MNRRNLFVAGLALPVLRNLANSLSGAAGGLFSKLTSRSRTLGTRKRNYDQAFSRSYSKAIKPRFTRSKRYPRMSVSKPAFGFYKKPILGNQTFVNFKTNL